MALTFQRDQFDRAFDEVVLGGKFFEPDDYYPTYRRRYRKTVEYMLEHLELPEPFHMAEIGGGQVLLLSQQLFGATGKVIDVNDQYAQPIREQGLEHAVCDLLRDDLPDRDRYDVLVMCEVVEHLPIPCYLVFQRLIRWIKPGGYILITTPNLHRLRNLIHLALGKPTFQPLIYGGRGEGLGHPFEMSKAHLAFHLKRGGFTEHHVEITTLVNRSMNPAVNVARLALSPLHAVRPLLQENLIAHGRRPLDAPPAHWDDAEAQRLAREWLEQQDLTDPRGQ